MGQFRHLVLLSGTNTPNNSRHANAATSSLPESASDLWHGSSVGIWTSTLDIETGMGYGRGFVRVFDRHNPGRNTTTVSDILGPNLCHYAGGVLGYGHVLPFGDNSNQQFRG